MRVTKADAAFLKGLKDASLTVSQLEYKYLRLNENTHPAFPKEDWQHKVSINETQLGYWDWVYSKYNSFR